MTSSNSTADLFTESITPDRPLAERMRPARLEQYVGQAHLLESGKPLRRAIESGKLHSMIFWGPPGTGKTTLARLLAHSSGYVFQTLSAVLAGVKEIRACVEQAKQDRAQSGRGTLLFIDEVHRFNKSQQDAFLPHVEDGTLLFVGATTENPSFELNNALLSRARVYVLKPLEQGDLVQVLRQALADTERGLGKEGIQLDREQLDLLAQAADGDARRALNMLEMAASLAENGKIEPQMLAEICSGQLRRFDKGGEAFYDQISALHKSVRGSSPDAALYWLCRMLDGGCDPRYLARRIIRMAWEDIGLADPRAMQIANDAALTYERLGSPEGELALSQAVVYLAVAAKSNAGYVAYNQARAFVKQHQSSEVPIHLRNAPTKLMKELGYGKAYRYAHDEPNGYAAGENYFPEDLGKPSFYNPVDRGLESKIRERLAWLKQLDDAQS